MSSNCMHHERTLFSHGAYERVMMRPLRRKSDDGFELSAFKTNNISLYAILSHTWIDSEEVTYDELVRNGCESVLGLTAKSGSVYEVVEVSFGEGEAAGNLKSC